MHSSSALQTLQPDWDGQLLTFRAAGEHRIGVSLDNCRFAELGTDTEGHVGLEIPFSPSGRSPLSVQIHSLDPPDQAESQAFSVELGKAGTRATTAHSDTTTEPAPIGKHLPCTAQPMHPEVVVVIPVYNAAAAVKRCLDSVLANSSGRCRLIVIDDASTDEGIAPLLASYRGIDGVEIHANPVNLGFTATVNRGMVLAGTADVVLLNADTEVASQWLTGLRRATYSSDDIATATAVSNNAGAFSVPELERENPLPAGWNFEQTARAHWQLAGHVYPQLPTGNGFCMYIRRSVLDRIGLFDVEAFPQGYGEENDFCQRACAAGYRHVIAGNVLVLHARSMSFGAERRMALGQAGMQVLRERWPDYESDVGRQLFSFERRALDWRVRRIHALAAFHVPQPRVLRFCGQADPAPMSGYDVRMLELTGDLLSLDGNTVSGGQATDQPTSMSTRVAGLLEDYAIELLEVEQGMDPGLIEQLKTHATRLGIPLLALASGERATRARRDTALHSLNRFERLT